eukprot:TRINITY_DN3377_c0_g3_i2.p1 TRINITY_DN3377_c0_g3~~TRINITY_DN3377_c0_g3_i2.p1  ORF type:complete len:230 (-),score=30.60 TRINITY_DN3377_c0_g3_i2:143-832(-)
MSDVSEEVSRVLSASNFYSRLSLTAEMTQKSSVRQAYYKIALQIHPDKCTDARATDAFKHLSEAFETLYDTTTQETYLFSLSQPKRNVRGKCSARDDPRGKPKSPPPKQWRKKSMEEVLRDLKKKEAEEKALREQFTANMKSRFANKRMIRDIETACRIAEDLDRQSGIEESELWPISNEIFDAGEQGLRQLLNHIRSSHFFCIYCGVRYDDQQDLEGNCPGPFHEDHN